MTPKATLLSTAGKDYIFHYGRKSYFFKADQAQDVPVAVALILEKKLVKKGKKMLPLFEIERMPEIVEAAEVRVPEVPDQNEPVTTGQMQFEGLGHGSNH